MRMAIPRTNRMEARPVWARVEARYQGDELGEPTEEEKADAIRVLADGIMRPFALYVEAEEIMRLAAGEAPSSNDEWRAAVRALTPPLRTL